MKKQILLASMIITSAVAGQAQTAASAGELKISGFFDFRLSSYEVKDSATVTNTHPETGFGLEDGALYLNYENGPLSMLVDIPFRRMKNADQFGNTASGQGSDSGTFMLGSDKAQAYGRYKAHDYLTVVAGQFDTPFGLEVNDSKDRFFGKTGLVYDLFLPVTHSGALLESTYAGFTFKAMSANPNNKGSMGTTTGDNNFEYAVLVGWANEMARAQVGYLTRPVSKASGDVNGNRNLLDVTAGVTWEALSADIEFSQLSDDSKNIMTPGNTGDKEDAAVGMLALVSYKINDAFSAGIRYENVDKIEAISGSTKGDSYGASLHYQITPQLEGRTEYIGYNFKDAADKTSTAQRFNLAGIFRF